MSGAATRAGGRMFPTARDDAHELGIVRERKMSLYRHYGTEACLTDEYGQLRHRERVLATRVFGGLR